MEQETNQKLDHIVEIVTSLVETVNFIKDNSVPYEEFSSFRKEVNEQFKVVDKRFAGLHQEMNERFDGVTIDLRAIRGDVADIKTRLTTLEKRTIEDADTAAHDIVDAQKRIATIEKHLGIFKKMQTT